MSGFTAMSSSALWTRKPPWSPAAEGRVPNPSRPTASRRWAPIYPADARLAVGEELYAGPARIAAFSRYISSLRAQDVLRFLIVLLILMKVLGLW